MIMIVLPLEGINKQKWVIKLNSNNITLSHKYGDEKVISEQC